MSMYNIVHGVNEFAGVWLEVLDLKTADAGRFRDCYLQPVADIGEWQKAGGGFEIHLFTRNGGGNRADHEEVTRRLRAHSLYLRDFDEAFDSTYATYVFRLSDFAKYVASKLVEAHPLEAVVPDPPGKRFSDFMKLMKTNPQDPHVQRVTEAMRPTLEALVEGGPSVVAVIDGEFDR